MVAVDIKRRKLLKVDPTILPPARRFHVGEIIGRFLLIYGGEDFSGLVLDDLQIMDISTLEWTSAKIARGKVALSHAASTTVLTTFTSKTIRENKNIEWHEIPVKKGIGFPYYQGMYIFGGKKEDGSQSNDLYVIRVGKNKYTAKKVKSKGLAPIERSECSLNYYEEINVLVLYGGISGYDYLNDLFLFDLENLQWMRMLIKGPSDPRSQHTAQIIDQSLYILGGISECKYANPDLYKLYLGTSDEFDTLVSEWIPKKKYVSTTTLPTIGISKKETSIAEIERKINRRLTVQIRKKELM